MSISIPGRIEIDTVVMSASTNDNAPDTQMPGALL